MARLYTGVQRNGLELHPVLLTLEDVYKRQVIATGFDTPPSMDTSPAPAVKNEAAPKDEPQKKEPSAEDEGFFDIMALFDKRRD